ncbi:unnamed protein product [Symbiodinium sp. CCMP2456]|nr:unnamed protein product [Symbiodinium sp. CCMP2456]
MAVGPVSLSCEARWPFHSKAFLVTYAPHRRAGLGDWLRWLQPPLAHEPLTESLGLLKRRLQGFRFAAAQLHVLGNGEVEPTPFARCCPRDSPTAVLRWPASSTWRFMGNSSWAYK